MGLTVSPSWRPCGVLAFLCDTPSFSGTAFVPTLCAIFIFLRLYDYSTGRSTDSQTRFGSSSLHQRDPRSALFGEYDGGASSRSKPSSSPRASPGYGYGVPSSSSNDTLGVGDRGGFRPATPNRKGQYSDAVLNELESQNDGQVEGILGKVRMLKDVRILLFMSLLSSALRTANKWLGPVANILVDDKRNW